MLDWLTNTIAALGGWMTAHPAAVAWALAWLAALSAAQSAKSLLFPVSWSSDRAKRSAQAVAIVVGGAVAWVLWPDGNHRVVLSLIVGMSAPTAYTFVKACIEARFPDLANALSWKGVKDRKNSCNREDSQ
jgi:hypothetical protein